MKRPAKPFRVPRTLPADLMRVEAYWRGLLRGSAKIPFSDDVNLPALPDLRPRLLLIEVFASPERFRLNIVGEEVQASTRQSLVGRFTDEVEPESPLDFLRSQACAAVESGAPTFYRRAAIKSSDRGGYSRLLLPMWGDGHINMLLGAVEWSAAAGG